MAAVQQGNLNDWYAAAFVHSLHGILANPEYHAEKMDIGDLMDQTELIALAAINRINAKAGDFSVVTPPIAGFTGQNLKVAPVTVPIVPPAPTYNPPGIVKKADGSQA